MSHMTVILAFDSRDATLDRAGGKGANLVRLVRAGFPVPVGFIIATSAYRAFVDANGLAKKIVRTLADNPGTLEVASVTIRQAFRAGDVPAELARDIAEAYAVLARQSRQDHAPVAVRSSATAEDLPDLSFAGQQDTYLNIIGIDNVLRAVINCWSSLWTARAIEYRARNQVANSEVALAVVVQAMVPSQVSGVLFTANPLTGARDEMMIEATLGLGEALVSGQVDPDNYVVNVTRKIIIAKSLGANSDADWVTQDRRVTQPQALPDDRILQLAALGLRVADYFESPQDIEWAWAAEQFWLLQARPITTL